MSEDWKKRFEDLEALIKNNMNPLAGHGAQQPMSEQGDGIYKTQKWAKSARILHDPPMSETETQEVLNSMPPGRYLTTAQWALMLEAKGDTNAHWSARRHLYWLSQKGFIKWHSKQAGYSTPIRRD